MCGHIGIFRTGGDNAYLSLNERNFFNQGLFSDMIRGKDGTGVIRINIKKPVEIIKRPINAMDFIDSKIYDQVTDFPLSIKGLLGHNRSSTIGGNIYSNTHPFNIGNISLNHNGTLQNHYSLLANAFSKFGTDSEILTHCINEEGIENIIPRVNGSFALVWHDNSDNTVNFLRNDDRSFYFTNFEKNGIAYASEEGLLRWLLNRNNIKYDKIYYTKPGLKYTFHLDIENNTYQTAKIKMYEITKGYAGNYNRDDIYSYYRERENHIYENKEKINSSKKKDKLFEFYNLVRDQIVDLIAYDFIPYKNSNKNLGSLIGSILDEPWLKIQIPRVKRGEYIDGGHYQASARSIKKDGEEYNDSYIIGNKLIWIAEENENHISSNISQINSKSEIKTKSKISKFIGSTFNKKEKKKEKENEKEIFDGNPSLLYWGDDSYLMGPNNLHVKIKDWKHLTRFGCQKCSGNLETKDHLDILWLDSGTPLCPPCGDEYTKPGDKDKNPMKRLTQQKRK